MLDLDFEGRDGLVENVDGRVGLGDCIKQGGETVYEALCSGIDPIFRDNEQTKGNGG